MYEVYETDDGILPILSLADPCEVRVEITEEKVSLQIGPRDFSWSRKTGELTGAGTEMSGGAIPFDPENPNSQHTIEPE